MIKRVLSTIAILSLLSTSAWATTTTTTLFKFPKPPLGTTGTADGYNTLMDTAETTLLAYLGGSLTGKGNYGVFVNAGGTGFTVAAVPAIDSVATHFLDGTGTYRALAATDFPAALTPTTIELGHASDTTIARSAAGAITVEGVAVPTISSTSTLTNKRVTPRVKVLPYNDATQTVGETADYDTDLADMFSVGTPASGHGIAAGMDFGAPGGTPTDGQKLIFRLYFATAQTITWNAVFASRGVTLPGAASGGTAKYVTVGFLYNALASKWDCVAVATEP